MATTTTPSTRANGRARRVGALLLVLAAVALLRWQVIGSTRVVGDSMRPTLRPGDVLVLDELAPSADTGDVVVFDNPLDGARTVKRVVATAGQRVEIDDAVLVVDGVPQAEPQVDHDAVDGLYFGPVTVPPGEVFLLGDSRNGSIDSRIFGSLPLADVDGRVIAHFPLPQWP